MVQVCIAQVIIGHDSTVRTTGPEAYRRADGVDVLSLALLGLQGERAG